jgi:hypothetical protein
MPFHSLSTEWSLWFLKPPVGLKSNLETYESYLHKISDFSTVMLSTDTLFFIRFLNLDILGRRVLGPLSKFKTPRTFDTGNNRVQCFPFTYSSCVGGSWEFQWWENGFETKKRRPSICSFLGNFGSLSSRAVLIC